MSSNIHMNTGQYSAGMGQPQKPTKVEFMGMQFDIETFKFTATSFYYLMIFVTVWYSFKFFFMLVK